VKGVKTKNRVRRFPCVCEALSRLLRRNFRQSVVSRRSPDKLWSLAGRVEDRSASRGSCSMQTFNDTLLVKSQSPQWCNQAQKDRSAFSACTRSHNTLSTSCPKRHLPLECCVAWIVVMQRSHASVHHLGNTDALAPHTGGTRLSEQLAPRIRQQREPLNGIGGLSAPAPTRMVRDRLERGFAPALSDIVVRPAAVRQRRVRHQVSWPSPP
jgi:hypothetical protein